MKLSTEVKYYKEALWRLLYPSACGVCSVLLELNEEALCDGCRREMAAVRYAPEDMLSDETFESVQTAWSFYPYESPVREILKAVKFSKKRWLLQAFTEDFKRSEMIFSEGDYHAVVPIPMDRKKRLEREFNQAEAFGEKLASRAGLPLLSSALEKPRSTPAQARLGRRQRRVNLYRAFRLSKSARVEGLNLLLVDDVLTTGATAEEAASVLLERGARRVDLLTIARSEHGTEASL